MGDIPPIAEDISVVIPTLGRPLLRGCLGVDRERNDVAGGTDHRGSGLQRGRGNLGRSS